MHWSALDTREQTIWKPIVEMREELDRLTRTIPGALFFVSAITARYTQVRSNQGSTYKIHPYVMYWLVSKTVTDSRSLCDMMNRNNCGAQVKIMLQPYQTTEQDISNALFNAVKDNTAGCVRRLVEDSCEYCYGPSERQREPLVKFYVARGGPAQMLSDTIRNLAGVAFRADLLDI